MEIKSQITPYFQNIEHHIIGHLGKAQRSILVAMAWLTNQRITDELLKAYRKGILLEIVVDANDTNKSSKGLNELSNQGVKVRFAEGLKELVEKRTMHNKFCVIDNLKVITGSYNWSHSAEKYHNENIVVIEDEHVALDYRLEFKRLDFSNSFVIELDNFSHSNQTYIDKFKEEAIKLLKQIVESKSDFKNHDGNLADFDLEEIKREIKANVEETTLLIRSKTAKFWGYLKLIDEYGQQWEKHAPPEKIIQHDDKNRKNLILEIEASTVHVLDNIRFKGLCQVFDGYKNTLQANRSEDEISRIMRVVQFLVSERKKLAERLGVVVVSPSQSPEKEANTMIRSDKQKQEALPADFANIYQVALRERQN